MKRIHLVTLLLLCFVLLSAGLIAHAQTTDVTLTAWTHDQLYLNFFEQRLPDFQALHPELNITFEGVFDSAAPTNALNAIAAGEPLPDMLGIERGAFANFTRNDIIAQYFLDLTDLIEADRDDYAAGRLAIYTYQGKLYALESQLAA